MPIRLMTISPSLFLLTKKIMKKIIAQKQIEIEGVPILLLQKRIKNLNLKIFPPTGEVRVSAPLRLSMLQITKFLTSRIDWIRKKQIEIRQRKIILPAQFISGEMHLLFGKELELKLIENSSSNSVLVNGEFLEMRCKKNLNLQQKQKLLDGFYRDILSQKISELVAKYEAKMAVKIAEFRVRKMKTRWGTCNVKARRIWISTSLAQKNISCLELIVVHEMTHLFERGHNKKFYSLMTKFFPEWKLHEVELKNKGSYSPEL